MGLSESANRSDVLEEGFLSKRITFNDVAAPLRVGVSDLANRQELVLYNDGSNTCYIGTSSVATSGDDKGIPLEPRDTMTYPVSNTIYGICETGLTTAIIVQEFK